MNDLLSGLQIPWHEVKSILEAHLTQERAYLDEQADSIAIYRAQGSIRCLKYLLNLPQHLKERREQAQKGSPA